MKMLLSLLLILTVTFASAQFSYDVPTSADTEQVMEIPDSFNSTPSLDVEVTPVSLSFSDTEEGKEMSRAGKLRLAGAGTSVLGLALISAGNNKREKANQGNVLQNAVDGEYRKADTLRNLGVSCLVGGLALIVISF